MNCTCGAYLLLVQASVRRQQPDLRDYHICIDYTRHFVYLYRYRPREEGRYVKPIRRLRAEKQMTVRELAQASGVNKNTISNLEHGLRKPRLVTLGKLADALGVPVEALEETPIPPQPRTPLADETLEAFDERFAATDLSNAEALREKLEAENKAISAHIQQLRKARISGFPLRRALDRQGEASARLYAATRRATDLDLNAGFGEERPIYDSVAEYVVEIGAVKERIEGENTEARARVI